MKYLQNIHTHTTCSDGINQPEEIVKKAIELGFDTIGFSEHSPMYFSDVYNIRLEGNEIYRDVIPKLKDKYKGTIDIYMGIELEICAMIDLSPYDYVLGALHYFPMGEDIVAFDRSPQEVKDAIDKYFGGNGLLFAKRFYDFFAETVTGMKEKIDVIAHYDLCAKHRDFYKFFDEDSKEYKNYALEALHAIGEKVDIFEINTGGMARGYRKTPYPASFIVKELKNMGKGVILGSDCHDMNYLTFGFDDGVELLKSNGFKSVMVLTPDGFKETGL